MQVLLSIGLNSLGLGWDCLLGNHAHMPLGTGDTAAGA